MSNFNSMAGVTGLYRVTLTGQEPVEVRIIGADVMRYEQSQNKSFFAGDVSFTRVAWVAWAAMKRKGFTDLSVADFLKEIEDVEREAQADDAEELLADDGTGDLGDPTEAVFTG